jgi:N-acetylmuramoyl-L-alanine amidase
MKSRRSTRIPLDAPHRAALALAVTVCLGALLLASPAHAAPLVVIDAGHGGPYNHASYGSLTEKAANLLFALELGARLQGAGYRVTFTRTSDVAVGAADIPTWHWVDTESRWVYAPDGVVWYSDGVPRDDLQARANIANRLGADMFISVHCNGSSSAAANGTENWASSNDRPGQALGQYVQGAVLEQTGQRNRGAGVTSFYVTKWANMPALLLETGFMSNPTEGAWIANPAWRSRYVTGVVNGVNRWMATNPFHPLYGRVAGATASGTAVSASRANSPSGASTILLSSVADPVSALAAPLGLTGLDAPILYADLTGVSAETAAEIARLNPSRIIALGSPKMLPDAFLEQAATAAGIDTSAVMRVAGSESAAVAPLLCESIVATDVPMTVVFANAARLTDSLCASTIAASRGAALILTRPDGSLPPEAEAFLAAHEENITAAISVGAVSDSVSRELPNRTRIGGGDAYRTAVSVMQTTNPTGPLALLPYNPDVPTDGIIAAALAARSGSVALPINGSVLSPYIREWLENVYPRIYHVAMVGNTGSLPTVTEHMIEKTIR